jgi:dipeptidyl aminopeptidase/acylaminoacyl peptidase
MKQQRAFGTWSSPISPRMLAGGVRLSDVQWDSDGETLLWAESRAGQSVLMAQRGNDAPRDMTESEMSVRGRVGYGGGEFHVDNGMVVFAGNGGRLYRVPVIGGQPKPITPPFGSAASPRISPDGKWVMYVHHDGRTDGLAVVDIGGSEWGRKLAFGTDFVMQPTWHPAGDYIAYIAWNQPQMPWDGTELRLAKLANDHAGFPYVESMQTIAGDTDTSIFQPEFSPDGKTLAYVSDASDWWQIYLYNLKTGKHTQLTTAEAEHAVPAWVQGLRTYGWSRDSQAIYSIRSQNGVSTLWGYDVETGKSVKRGDPAALLKSDRYTDLRQVAVSPKSNAIALLVSSSKLPERVVSFDSERQVTEAIIEFVRLYRSNRAPLHELAQLLSDNPDLAERGTLKPDTEAMLRRLKNLARDDQRLLLSPEIKRLLTGLHAAERIHRYTSAKSIDESQLSEAQAIEWVGHDGETVYGIYYPPTSDRFEGIGQPPLIVYVHGGPTSQRRVTYDAEVQFYATRGYAVLQVNHRGSTGYGKAYKDKHRGAWGYYDVEDSASGASYLAAQGLADPSKFVILGGSAGGYTVLQSLVSKPGFYKAGICLYGISNQFTLVSEAEFKFEERYSETLLGRLPQDSALYRQRSPLFHADQIVDPVIIFQGDEDNVVPKSQSDGIVAVLRERGVPHEYHVFSGEGHGFRKPETIEAYLKATLKFLERYVVYA